MVRALRGCLVLGVVIASAGWGTAGRADEPPIKDVMWEAHRKPEELLKKVTMGQATDRQKQRLWELYAALGRNKPPRGSAAGWKAKADLLMAAADAARQGQPDAAALLNKASNCNACHREHK